MLFVPKCLNQLHFLTFYPQLSHPTSLRLYSLYAFFSSLFSSAKGAQIFQFEDVFRKRFLRTPPSRQRAGKALKEGHQVMPEQISKRMVQWLFYTFDILEFDACFYGESTYSPRNQGLIRPY